MVQFSVSELERAAREVTAALGGPRARQGDARLLRYLTALATHGAHTDLFGAREAPALAEIALADALVLERRVELLAAPTWEVGAGGASLLVPLALLSDAVAGVLVEPRQKRAMFLRLALGTFGLAGRLRVEQRRVEPRAVPRGVAASALARAVFAPAEWIPLAAALVSPGGTIVVLTTGALDAGPDYETLAAEDYTLPVTGGRRVATWLRARR